MRPWLVVTLVVLGVAAAALDQLGAEARTDAEEAVSDLSERINEAVGSGTAAGAPEGGR